MRQQRKVARALRGFGPVGIFIFVLVVFVGPAWLRAIMVLLWAVGSDTPLAEIGYVQPKSWLTTFTLGIALGVALKFFTKAAVLPLLGGPALNPAYHYLVGNTAALPGILFTFIVSAGFGEETVFRGYLFERFTKLFGRSRGATVVIVLVTAAIFASAHYFDQKLPGVEQAFITGLTFGGIFALTHQIWLPMVAHAAYDLTALAIIYYNLESTVAHLIFN